MLVPTVRVKHPEHPDGIVINETDFDAKQHELHGESSSDESTDSGKLKVADMRALLMERSVEIPEGAKKPDLQALIDALN